jgi:hypothetical protein
MRNPSLPWRPLASLVLALAAAGSYAQWSNPADDIPAYHHAPPARGQALPPLLTGAALEAPLFTYPWQKRAYQDAARIQPVIYQLPCYCRCDKSDGHQSLHSCFEDTHGAMCSTCAKEAFYAYDKTRAGWTTEQIRDGIMHHEYDAIDLKAVR